MAEAGSTATAGPTNLILIVDDEAPVRDVFRRTLEGDGYEAIEAADGATALAALRREPVSLVLLDITMPGIDGVEVVKQVRSREELRSLPIILVTALGELEDRVRGLEAGADDYLTKPVATDELLARIGAQLRARRAMANSMLRDAQVRRAVQDALRGMRTDPSPEMTARWIVSELSGALRGASVVLLAYDEDGILWPLASTGKLADPYRPGIPLDAAASADIRNHAASGAWVGWLGIGRVPRVPPRKNAPRFAFVPLGRAETPFGLLMVGPEGTDEPTEDTSALVRRLPILIDLADSLLALMRPGLQGSSRADRRRAALLEIATQGRFVIAFQPIVRLDDRSVLAYEALTRFDDACPPDLRFAEAERLGLGRVLERATLEASVRAATVLPGGAMLNLNVSPAHLRTDSAIAEILAATEREVVFELTGDLAMVDAADLDDRLKALPRPVKLAVHEAGVADGRLRQILALRPRYAKLDTGTVAAVGEDPVREALVSGLVQFTRAVDCALIGLGVETEAQRDKLIELGVALGQGSLFGAPEAAGWAR